MDEREVQLMIRKNIGTNYYAERVKPLQDKQQDQQYVVSIGASYPIVISDDRNNETIMKFLKFKNLANLFFSEKKGNLQLQDFDTTQLQSNLVRQLEMLNYRTEDSFINSCSTQMARISVVRTFMGPIYTLLNAVVSEGTFTKESLAQYPKSKRLVQYLNFLQQLDMIERGADGNYYPGNIPKNLEKKIHDKNKKGDNSQEIIDNVMGIAVKEGSRFLINELKLRIIKPYIQLGNAYYGPTVRIDELTPMTIDSILKEHYSIYGRPMNRDVVSAILSRLVGVKILRKEDNYYLGDKTIFSKMKTNLGMN